MRVLSIVLINTFAWLALHIGVAWLGERLSCRFLKKSVAFFKRYKIGSSVVFYEKFLKIKKWKTLIPDGSALFKGGFTKKKLQSSSMDYLNDFITETCRGEIVHWVVLFSGFLFFLWNDFSIACVMVVYGVVANLPCIFLLRYNRLRMWRITSNTPKKSRSGMI